MTARSLFWVSFGYGSLSLLGSFELVGRSLQRVS